MEQSQVWFTDLWNYSIVPYLVEAVREGLQLYGKRSSWEVIFIIISFINYNVFSIFLHLIIRVLEPLAAVHLAH